jgi:restriction system protein
MAIPDYQSAMLPLLKRVAEAKEPASIMELMPALAADFGLSAEEMAERLPSGMQGVFHNRLHWAKFYMTRAGLLETTKKRAVPDHARRLRPAENGAHPDNQPDPVGVAGIQGLVQELSSQPDQHLHHRTCC